MKEKFNVTLSRKGKEGFVYKCKSDELAYALYRCIKNSDSPRIDELFSAMIVYQFEGSGEHYEAWAGHKAATDELLAAAIKIRDGWEKQDAEIDILAKKLQEKS